MSEHPIVTMGLLQKLKLKKGQLEHQLKCTEEALELCEKDYTLALHLETAIENLDPE